jgi:hypothetical protein
MDIIHHPSLIKSNVSETVICLHSQVKPTLLGPIDRAGLYLCSVFCVKCEGNKVTDFVKQRRGVRRDYIVSPYCQLVGKMSIPGRLFADDLEIR